MATIEIACCHCYQTNDVVEQGEVYIRYQCRLCECYSKLDYIYNAYRPGVKQQIVDIMMSSFGVSDIPVC